MRNSEYDIIFKGLSKDLHCFNYKINKKNLHVFFHSEELMQNCYISVDVELNNRSIIKELYFNIKGFIYTFCDTCNGQIIIKINSKNKLILKPNNTNYQDDEIIFIDYNNRKINIIKFVYEYIMLSLPMKKTCFISEKKTSCDKKMINDIKKYIYK